jgi:membrane protease YdiL (CAAX protease family)
MLAFILLSFGISWLLWSLVALTGLDINQNLTVGLAYVLGGFGPAIAGIILAQRDPASWSDFWPRSLQIRRIRPKWWVVILLLYPATLMLAYLIGAFTSSGAANLAPSDNVVGRSPAFILLTLLFIVILGPVSEEPGWRGYALDRLQARYSPLVASLILGAIWWAWHLPLLFVQGSFLQGSGASPVFLTGYLGTVILYSILFTWVYNHTERSILASIIFHFSINLTTGILAPPYEVFMVTTFLLIVIAAVVTVRWKLWHTLHYPLRDSAVLPKGEERN